MLQFSLQLNCNGIRPFQSQHSLYRAAMGRMLPRYTFSYGLRSKCADLAE